MRTSHGARERCVELELRCSATERQFASEIDWLRSNVQIDLWLASLTGNRDARKINRKKKRIGLDPLEVLNRSARGSAATSGSKSS